MAFYNTNPPELQLLWSKIVGPATAKAAKSIVLKTV